MRPAKENRPPARAAYRALLARFGSQRWWPARSRVEMIAGAVLTQNTAWANVEKAVRRLRRERALSFARLHSVPLRTLSRWIRPSGTHSVKARRLRAFTTMVARDHGGSVRRALAGPTDAVRNRLLAVHGIGPETADSILLYAAKRPVFVADAYARRVAVRHGWIHARASYDQLAALFADNLPADAAVLNEYHALIVALGKAHCRARPRCAGCPLKKWLPRGGPRP